MPLFRRNRQQQPRQSRPDGGLLRRIAGRGRLQPSQSVADRMPSVNRNVSAPQGPVRTTQPVAPVGPVPSSPPVVLESPALPLPNPDVIPAGVSRQSVPAVPGNRDDLAGRNYTQMIRGDLPVVRDTYLPSSEDSLRKAYPDLTYERTPPPTDFRTGAMGLPVSGSRPKTAIQSAPEANVPQPRVDGISAPAMPEPSSPSDIAPIAPVSSYQGQSYLGGMARLKTDPQTGFDRMSYADGVDVSPARQAFQRGMNLIMDQGPQRDPMRAQKEFQMAYRLAKAEGMTGPEMDKIQQKAQDTYMSNQSLKAGTMTPYYKSDRDPETGAYIGPSGKYNRGITNVVKSSTSLVPQGMNSSGQEAVPLSSPVPQSNGFREPVLRSSDTQGSGFNNPYTDRPLDRSPSYRPAEDSVSVTGPEVSQDPAVGKTGLEFLQKNMNSFGVGMENPVPEGYSKQQTKYNTGNPMGPFAAGAFSPEGTALAQRAYDESLDGINSIYNSSLGRDGQPEQFGYPDTSVMDRSPPPAPTYSPQFDFSNARRENYYNPVAERSAGLATQQDEIFRRMQNRGMFSTSGPNTLGVAAQPAPLEPLDYSYQPFTSASGQKTLNAKVLSMRGSNVTMQFEDGSQSTVPLSSLDEESRNRAIGNSIFAPPVNVPIDEDFVRESGMRARNRSARAMQPGGLPDIPDPKPYEPLLAPRGSAYYNPDDPRNRKPFIPIADREVGQQYRDPVSGLVMTSNATTRRMTNPDGSIGNISFGPTARMDNNGNMIRVDANGDPVLDSLGRPQAFDVTDKLNLYGRPSFRSLDEAGAPVEGSRTPMTLEERKRMNTGTDYDKLDARRVQNNKDRATARDLGRQISEMTAMNPGMSRTAAAGVIRERERENELLKSQIEFERDQAERKLKIEEDAAQFNAKKAQVEYQTMYGESLTMQKQQRLERSPFRNGNTYFRGQQGVTSEDRFDGARSILTDPNLSADDQDWYLRNQLGVYDQASFKQLMEDAGYNADGLDWGDFFFLNWIQLDETDELRDQLAGSYELGQSNRTPSANKDKTAK